MWFKLKDKHPDCVMKDKHVDGKIMWTISMMMIDTQRKQRFQAVYEFCGKIYIS